VSPWRLGVRRVDSLQALPRPRGRLERARDRVRGTASRANAYSTRLHSWPHGAASPYISATRATAASQTSQANSGSADHFACLQTDRWQVIKARQGTEKLNGCVYGKQTPANKRSKGGSWISVRSSMIHYTRLLIRLRGSPQCLVSFSCSCTPSMEDAQLAGNPKPRSAPPLPRCCRTYFNVAAAI